MKLGENDTRHCVISWNVSTNDEMIEGSVKNTTRDLAGTHCADELELDANGTTANTYVNREPVNNVASADVKKETEKADLDGTVPTVVRDDADEKSGSNENEQKNEHLPIDRGWAWVVLVACFFENLLLNGYFKCGGIFFVQLQRHFRSSAAETSVIMSLQNVFFSLSAPIVMNLGESMSSRVSIILGSITLAGFYLATGFVENLAVAYVTIGAMMGVSFALIHPNVITTLNTYFERYRGLASNIAGAGVSVGALALAPLYTAAFEYYGFTGAFMIVSGLFLNAVVVGMLLRPMTSFERKRKGIQQTEVLHLTEELEPLNDSDKMSLHETEIIDECQSRYAAHNAIPHGSFHGSLSSLTNGIQLRVGDSKGNIDETHTGHSNRFTRVIRNIPKQFNSAILKKSIFQYYMLCNMCICSGCIMIESFIPPHAFDVGVETSRVPMLITVSAIADIVSKVVFGYLSDRKWIKRSTMMAVVYVVLGACSFFVVFFNSFPSLLAFSVVSGSLYPLYFILYPVITVDLLSLKELKGALGYIALAQGVTNASVYPLAGYLRDVTGRYHATFYFAGSLLTIGGLLSYFLPHVKSRCDREKQAHGVDLTLVSRQTDVVAMSV